MGLLSDGGVHSRAPPRRLLELAARHGGAPRALHAFTDGRDTPPKSAPRVTSPGSRTALSRGRHGRIATVSGRYYAMDRDKRWDRVARAYRRWSFSARGRTAQAAEAAVEAAYARGETDEFIQPTVLTVKRTASPSARSATATRSSSSTSGRTARAS